MNAIDTKAPTHTATLNGYMVPFHADDYDAVVGKLVREHGPGVPKIEPVTIPGPKSEPRAVLVAPPAPKLAIGEYDAKGDARSQVDRDAAVAAGFAPAAPVYRQGSRATGMERHRAEFDALPLAVNALERLEAEVAGEHRRDLVVEKANVRMSNVGALALPGARMQLDRRAFGSLVSRLDMPGGASQYLAAVDPDIRAANVNNWVTRKVAAQEDTRRAWSVANGKEFSPETLVLRTRDNRAGAGREVFGVVSEEYGDFDADKIAQAVRLACRQYDGARADIAYDGRRTKIDVTFFSNIDPGEAVAGEFFKAAARVRTDDTGGGSIAVDAMIWQNLCLNFIIVQEDAGVVARIRHVGSVDELAKRFRKAFGQALQRLVHFTESWGYAVREDVLPRSLLVARESGVIAPEQFDEYVALPVSKALPGIFNGLIERDLVPLPKRDRKETVAQLMTMWERDTSAAVRERQAHLSRAAVVNAVTRYAHEVNADPFAENELEAAAGALLTKRALGTALPFAPLAL